MPHMQIMGGQGQSSLTVEVVPSDLVSIISGGHLQTWRFGEEMRLDGSESYDADTLENSQLFFSWKCASNESESLIALGVSFCDDVIPFESGIGSGVVLSRHIFDNDESLIGAKFKIYLIVSGSYNRSATTSVLISIAPSLSPKITILSSPSKVTFDQQIRIKASVQVFEPVTTMWSVSDPNIDMEAISLIPSLSFSLSEPGIYSVNLAIREWNLDAGLWYDFTLSVGEASHSTVSVLVVNPPRPGEFIVSPPSGRELRDHFLLFTSKWTDTEFPLSYEFGFKFSEADVTMLPIRGKSESNYVDNIFLPGGFEKHNHSVVCVVNALNNLNAKSSLNRLVSVFPTPLSAADLEKTIQNRIEKVSTSQNMDEVKAVVSLGVSMLNKVNCTLAPSNCTVLGRHECRYSPNVCGSCLDGFLSDREGDGNTQCFLNPVSSGGAWVSSSSNDTCDFSSQCQPLQHCYKNLCTFRNKSCVSDCTGDCMQSVSKGQCIFELTSGEIVSQCLVNDFTCRARFICDEGHYGVDCSETLASMQSKRNTRLSLLMSLNSTVRYEEMSSEAVESRASLVYDLGSNPLELVEESCGVLQTVVEDILRVTAQDIEISDSIISRLLTVLDNCAELYVQIIDDMTRQRVYDRQASVSIESVFSAIQLNKDLRLQCMDLASEAMITGQKQKSFSDNTHFRSIVSKSSLADTLDLSLPKTQLESFFNLPKSAVRLEGLTDSNITHEVTRSMVLEENNVKMIPNASRYSSNPLTLRYSMISTENISSKVSNPSFTVVLHNFALEAYITNESNTVAPTSFSTYCTPSNKSDVMNYMCPDGENIVHQCNGEYETIRTVCPTLRLYPTCYVLSNSEDSSSTLIPSCSLVSFTDANVTCNCTFVITNRTAERRRMATSSIKSSGYMEMVAMSVYTYEGFVATLREVDDLTLADVNNGLIVIFMFCALWGCGLIGLFEIARGQYWQVSPSSQKSSTKRSISNRSSSSVDTDVEVKKEYLLRWEHFFFHCTDQQLLIEYTSVI